MRILCLMIMLVVVIVFIIALIGLSGCCNRQHYPAVIIDDPYAQGNLHHRMVREQIEDAHHREVMNIFEGIADKENNEEVLRELRKLQEK